MPLCRRFIAISLFLLALASPAAAQWSQVPQVPSTRIFSVRANGDTIAAGADTAVYLSTDAGATWKRTAKPVAGVTSIQAVLVRNGRLYAGTFGQGVFVSDNLGDSWQAFNQGLVGGFLDSQLDLSDLAVRGDSLYAATLGAGVYVRSFAAGSTWHHFGEELEPNQASNVEALVLGGTRLLVAAGANGQVFFRDPGDPDWTTSNLDNVGLHPALSARSIAWNGNGWVVGTNLGLFSSVAGEEPWTRFNPAIGTVNHSALATLGTHYFVAFDIVAGALIAHSADDGATWTILEGLSGAFVFKMATSGGDLYAGLQAGLWRRTMENASVPPVAAAPGLHFALAGPNPARDVARVRFELRAPGVADLELFDVTGRRATDRVRESWSAGSHEASLDVRNLAPGVYEARLSAEGRQEVLRVVHTR